MAGSTATGGNQLVRPAKQRPQRKSEVPVTCGYKNAGNTEHIFNELKKRMALRGSETLGTITIAKNSESKELMVADLLAHTYSMMRASNPTTVARPGVR
jgi:hypothetical protein